MGPCRLMVSISGTGSGDGVVTACWVKKLDRGREIGLVPFEPGLRIPDKVLDLRSRFHLATDETCHAQIAVRRQPVAPASAMASAIRQPSRARPERDFQCVDGSGPRDARCGASAAAKSRRIDAGGSSWNGCSSSDVPGAALIRADSSRGSDTRSSGPSTAPGAPRERRP
jgi:hypothetical protein